MIRTSLPNSHIYPNLSAICTCMRAGIILSIICAFFSSPAQSSEDSRNHTWSVKLGLGRHEMTSDSWHPMQGDYMLMGLGYGIAHDRWFVGAKLETEQGPYTRLPEQDQDLDFQTVNSGVVLGVIASPGLLRGSEHALGLQFGLMHTGFSARSKEPHLDMEQRLPTLAADKEYIADFTIHGERINLQPGVFISWLQSTRSNEQNESNQLTRLEGTRLHFYLNIPVFTRYKTSYKLFHAGNQGHLNRREKGRLNGLSWNAAIEFLLGT